MKVIQLDSQTKHRIINEYKKELEEEFNKKLEAFTLQCNTVVPEQKSHASNDKLNIYYTAEAFAKIVQLVFSHSQEIGWNMVVKKYKDGYRVEDVLVYPQKASGAYIEVDLPRYAMWKADPDKVSDEADANLFGQGHSHVMMATTPSSRDTQQQKDEVQLKGSGFYLFQIWNKRMEINSFFYDIDNNILYEKNDIELIVENGNNISTDFIAESKEMLIEEKPAVKPDIPSYPSLKKEKEKKDIFEVGEDPYEEDFYQADSFLNGYWPGYGPEPVYDW